MSQISDNRYEDPDLLERCRRFWHCEPVERPLVGVLVDRMFPLQTFKTGTADSTVTPDDVTGSWFLDECERRHVASEQTGGDAIFVAYPGIGLPWIEGILGCDVRIQSGTGWASSLPTDWKSYDDRSVQWNNGWFQKMQELTEAAIRYGGGKYPVGPCHMRSPIDLAAAMMGAEQMCLSIYEHPAELNRLLDIFSQVWLNAVEAQYQILPTYDGGYWNGNQPIWAPGKTMFITADAASLLSPRTLKEFVVPNIVRIVKGIDYGIMHTHSSHLHILNTVMDVAELRAIQVGIDDLGQSDPISSLIPKFREIQKHKALILALTEQDVEKAAAQARIAIRELSPDGLCIFSYLPAAEAGKRFLASL